jgi:hypothetical protein
VIGVYPVQVGRLVRDVGHAHGGCVVIRRPDDGRLTRGGWRGHGVQSAAAAVEAAVDRLEAVWRTFGDRLEAV